MDPVLSKLVAKAGSALSKYLVRAALGSQRRRALDRVCRRAVQRAVEAVSATAGVTELDTAHAVSLLERMISGAGEDDLPMLKPDAVGDVSTMRRWREIAGEQGLDTETFPLPFEKLVDRLLHEVAAEALHAAVDADGNALFPAVAVAHLEDLRRGVGTLTRLVKPSGQLAKALQIAYDSCRDRDRALYTPDVLLALLHLPDGSVTACFTAARPGFTVSLEKSLRGFQDKPVGVFCAFEWIERAEVRQAQIYAWAHGAPVITGPALLLGILDTPSGTRDSLVAKLGDDVEALRREAENRIQPVVQAYTPGFSIEDE